MTDVISHHHSNLGLPLGGPVLRPGVATKVDRWSIIKGHPVVRSWLAAKVIETVPEKATEAPPAPVEPAPVSVVAPEQPSAPPAGVPGDLKAELRSQYQELFGKRAYHGWDEAELQAKIDAKLAE